MNSSVTGGNFKCHCCVCEPVCKYKEVYLNGIGAILNATVSIKREDGKVGFMKVKDCPHMITNSGTIMKGCDG